MTIRHHLSDQLLMAYSAGELPEAFSLIVATHVSMCDECRARAAAFDAVGGALVETASAPSGEMDDMLARILALPQSRAEAITSRRRSVLPAPLTDYVGGDLESVRWRPVGMGVRQAILRTGKGASARLLYIPAGQSVPDHGHRGMELTLVLQGAFRDETDRFGPGDVEIATEEVDHTPVAEVGEACICLAATDAPLRFRSLIPRLAQPFLRI
ncbi:ChrR family anti-sigma-E factor [Tabrizicola sp. J26]|uniref:ChrR family anti-sigma-E factor n=1 Tax=Alitabrizicola rongguiensis TaxID=2909234 RepID=UPI001F193BF9|nr:ChrR family anti-sigma-E factor [Tabrizicola rongguiensis]MCF1710548.1 ChrR family anti-sigma-E factor [Tabrizicola rongguiensis]